MNEQNIARLEAQLERLVEGAFANLFGKTVRAQDIALQLSRAMEDGIKTARGSDPRPLAPDQYLIFLNPTVQAKFVQRQPALLEILSQHLVELATHAGYRLANAPLVKFLADPLLEQNRVVVKAEHTNRPENSTAIMQRVDAPVDNQTPRNPQVIINGEQTVHLGSAIVNIGRSRDNQIILEDSYISRHHVQLRLRFGAYTLFDVQSQGGTYVNDVRVKEHRLRAGDVIRIGRTKMVYIEDDPLSDSQSGTTGVIDAV
jgi:hypothetical protein